MTNEELVFAIQKGNYDSTEQLWKQCYGFIRQQAIRWAKAWEKRSDFDAEDLTQAGYIALCGAVQGYQEGRGSFIGYLAFYLKTEFTKIVGRTERQQNDPLNGAVSLDAPAYNDPDSDVTVGETIPFDEAGFDEVEDALFNQQLGALLDQAMEELTEKQRRAIQLYYLQGQTYNQIANEFHCATSYPGQLVKDGLKELKCGSYAPALLETLCGERNYYRHTSLSSWKHSGSSSPEWEVLKKEEKVRQWRIQHCVDRMGMTLEQANHLFPA